MAHLRHRVLSDQFDLNAAAFEAIDLEWDNFWMVNQQSTPPRVWSSTQQIAFLLPRNAGKAFGVKIAARLTDVQRQTIVRRTDAIRLSKMRAAR